MAKRLNPHRRLLAKQAEALKAARLEQSQAHALEMAKLQQGAVRSTLAPRVQLTGYAIPRDAAWEGRGKATKQPTKRPFSEAAKGPIDVNAPTAKVDVPNVAALRAAKVASTLQDRKWERQWGLKKS